MSKKSSKSMAIKSTINKSALSKSAAGKSSMGKKRATEEGKSKTADNQQRPTVSIDVEFGGNSGFSGLPPPPGYEGTATQQLTVAQEQIIKMLKGRIKERLATWYGVKEQLAEYEPKEVNDRRQPPPVPKYDESDFVATRIALHDYLGKIGVELEKMKIELKQLQLMAKEKAALPKKADDAPKSVQIVQTSTRKPVKKQRSWAIILIAICLTALVVLALVGLVVGVVLASKSDDVKTRASKSVTSEPAPDGQTGEASTNNGKSDGQGGGNTAPITTSSTAMSTTTTMPPRVNDYEIACNPQVLKGVSKECLIGSAPGSCSEEAVCWQMKFGTGKNGDVYRFNDNSFRPIFPPPSPDQKRMCKVNDAQLGSCDKSGQCNPDDRLIGKRFNERAEWKDNCDEPSPCWGGNVWEDEDEEFHTDWQWKRDHCTTTGACPTAYTHAVIWMQHVRRHAGNGRTANGTCQGLPLQLWVCRPCEYSEVILKQFYCKNKGWRPTTDPCTIECGKDVSWTRKVAPDGFNCTADDGQPSLCYKGQCFPIAKDARIDPIPTLDECNKTREVDKKMQAEFMRARRGAISFPDFTARINARSMPNDASPQTDALEKPTVFPIKSEDVEKKPHDE